MRHRSSLPAVLSRIVLAACALGAAEGCKRSSSAQADGGEASDGGAENTEANGAANAAATDADGGVAPTSGPVLYAFGAVAPIFSATEWPAKDPSKTSDDRKDVIKLGYFRRGEKVAIKPDPIKKANCEGGWYELLTGGFVCAKYATVDPNHKELKSAPHAPFLDRDLPFDYGLNLTPGTPLYRRVPLKAERKTFEKTLAIGKGVKSSDIAKKLKADGEEVPAYLKGSDDNKSHVGFDDLKGESSLVAERMLKGFYLALDKKVDGFSGSFWHTASGYYAPKDHLIVHETKKEFEGIDFTVPGETRKLPLAWIVSPRARECHVEGPKATRHDKIDRFTILQLTGKREVVDNRNYWETDKGFYVRDIDAAIVTAPSKPPADLTPGEKWIDVDLHHQSLIALEGDKPIFATIVSTGRHDEDPAKDHRTVEGSFRIREKHVTTTMDGDAAADGTYRIEDVPWVMYFEKSYALHGAFWHSMFGREKSHGCVNIIPHDARRVFMWAGPALPEGWHGVKATKDNPGTRVVVHK